MRSIRIKLWAGMMTLVIIVLILLWLFQIVFLENFYTRMKVNDNKMKNALTGTNYGPRQCKVITTCRQ